MRGLFILLFVAFCLYLFINVEPHQIEDLLSKQPQNNEEERIMEEEQPVIQSSVQSNETIDDIASLIGKSEQVILDIYGEPNRKDLSAYDYEWWIYNNNLENYIQFGVENGVVVTAFRTGSESNEQQFNIGQSYESLNEEFSFADSVTVVYEEGSYRFEMKEEELSTRPLVVVGDIYVQLYFDDFEKKLSSVRYLNAETLVKQRPYELVYRGPLLDPKELSADEWAVVEEGTEKQIIDFTNIIRNRFNQEVVEWDKVTAEVAYLHSKDMRTANYFSHTSPTTGSLSDRLMAGNVPFQYAGENIAAKYVDGVAAVEGWLNSEGHRKTLLNERFTHLGVGVSEKYYTQNFIETR
ncbi:CAP domain-containing protein [Sutcliffiella halmapala]|uniref:CAP domain-containing protein n=1 Tax=Sutcliffiella halmapala TaxID=79882 RepID=UPI0009953A21|nr:CAP domain-containing protein [Sutcliffiella halmapala]